MKSFVSLEAHKKVKTHDMLQLRKSYKALSLDVCCIWSMEISRLSLFILSFNVGL